MRSLLHHLLALRQDHLHMARIAHVRIDASMRPIRPTSLLRRLIDLDMLHNEIRSVETLSIGVGFRILQERDEMGRRFLRPARFGDAEFFACACLSVFVWRDGV